MTSRPAGQAILIACVLLTAANLRAPFTGLPPLLGSIQADLGLSSTALGAVTTLPLLAFALLSPFSARLARRHGLERTLCLALAAIAAGLALRSVGGAGALYGGIWLIGMGIAVGNVLLPSLLKRDFPHSVPTMTAAYAVTMGGAAALGSAAVFPLAQAWGWRAALAAFLILPLAALAAWAMQRRAAAPSAASPAATAPTGEPIWRSALAWQVTAFLGLNSTVYYVVIAWLPTLLIDTGMPPTEAGSLHGVMQLATALPGLVLGPLLRRMPDQRLPAVVATGWAALALLGLLLAPQFAWGWVVMFGLGSGAWFMLSIIFIGLRSRNAHQAATLSGMAQCVGYLLAAAGPITMGALHDALGSWTGPLALCAALAALAAGVGMLAGRNRQLAG